MKIEKPRKKLFHYTLIKLNLIKSQVYKKKIQKKKHDDVNNIKTEYTELYLKNVLQIIYKYHNINKKILFIGIPVSFQKKLSKILKKTRHIAIPQSIWINGVLSNRFAIFRQLYKKRLKNIERKKMHNKTIDFLFSVVRRPDLVVIFNPNLEQNALNETYKLKIPIITLNNNLYFDTKSSYQVPGNFKTTYKKKVHTIYFVLISILKKKRISKFTVPFLQKRGRGRGGVSI
jgi:ribosomal protein S2